LLALSDTVANNCAELGGEMARQWSSTERSLRRAVSFERADPGHYEPRRARCAAAGRLLGEIDAHRRPGREPLESRLRALVAAGRLLCSSIEDPRMPRSAFEATLATHGQTYTLLRPRIAQHLPLDARTREQVVGRMLPRWQELTSDP
jgi:hypothetical protein